MAKKYATDVGFNVSDVQAAIQDIVESNEGHDPEFKLELNDAEATVVLESMECDLETEMASIGFEMIKARMLKIDQARRDKTLRG